MLCLGALFSRNGIWLLYDTSLAVRASVHSELQVQLLSSSNVTAGSKNLGYFFTSLGALSMDWEAGPWLWSPCSRTIFRYAGIMYLGQLMNLVPVLD